jgi:hypothetical protein
VRDRRCTQLDEDVLRIAARDAQPALFSRAGVQRRPVWPVVPSH